MGKDTMNNPIARHLLSIMTVLVAVAVAWGAQSADVESIKDNAKAANVRIDKIEKRGIINSENLSRIDERTKLIFELVKEINRKLPVRHN